MPLQPGSSRSAISANIDELTHHGSRPRSHAQIVAIALANADRTKRADGGSTAVDAALHVMRRAAGGVSGADVPYFERQEARNIGEQPYGLSLGVGGGRTDKNNVSLASGSYVLPADIVSGLGDGNTLAGAHVWDQMLQSMPWGIAPPKSLQTHRPPAPPHDPSLMAGITGQQHQILADGGSPGNPQEVPIAAADGEIIVHPLDVLRVGQHYAPDHERKRGNIRAMMRRGHRIIDDFVKETRGRTIAHLKSLKGPVGSHNSSVGHVKK